MTSAARLSLHVPEPTVRPGGRPDFSHVGIAEAGEVPRPPIDVNPSEIRDFAYTMIRVLDDNGDAVGAWAGGAVARRSAQGPARHDADPRLRRAHAPLAAPGQDVVLHPVSRRGGDRDRPSEGAQAGRHVLSNLSPARPLDRLRLADRRHDVPDLRQRTGSSQGPAAARALFGQGGRILHRLRQSWHPISARGRLGDGLGDLRRYPHRLGLDRRRGDGGERLPFRAGVRVRLPAAGHSQRRQQPMGDLVLSGDRRRREREIRRPRARLRHPVAARRRQRLSCGLCGLAVGGRAGARQFGPDPDRMGDLPRRRAFDFGRPVEIPPQGRMGRLAPGRSDRAAEDPPHPDRRLERGTPQADAGRGRGGGAGGGESGGKPRHAP